MKIKALITLHVDGKSVLPGKFVDVEAEEAKSLIKRGFASGDTVSTQAKTAPEKPSAPTKPVPTLEDIVDVIHDLDPSQDYGKSGKPNVDALGMLTMKLMGIVAMTFKANALKAVDALFAKFGQAAHFTFKDNTTGEGFVIHRFPDKVVDVMDTHVHTETDLFEVKALDIEIGKAIYQIKIDDKTYTVQGEPMLDQHGIILRMEAYAS